MDIKILMDIGAQYEKVHVVFADDMEEVLACIHRVAQDSPILEIDEEMSAV